MSAEIRSLEGMKERGIGRGGSKLFTLAPRVF
jgi:hypothetical protein